MYNVLFQDIYLENSFFQNPGPIPARPSRHGKTHNILLFSDVIHEYSYCHGEDACDLDTLRYVTKHYDRAAPQTFVLVPSFPQTEQHAVI